MYGLGLPPCPSPILNLSVVSWVFQTDAGSALHAINGPLARISHRGCSERPLVLAKQPYRCTSRRSSSRIRRH